MYAYLISTVAGKKSNAARICREMAIRRQTWKKYSETGTYSRKPNAREISQSDVEDVEGFYFKNSTMLGGKKYTDKEGCQKRAMNITLRSAYNRWMQQLGMKKMSFSFTFPLTIEFFRK